MSQRHALWPGRDRSRTRRPARQRGIALVLVMGAVAMAMLIVMPFMAAQSTSVGVASNAAAQPRARFIAESGLDAALAYTRAQGDWRTQKPAGTWVQAQPYGGGTYTVERVNGMDENGDGDIDDAESNDGSGPVTLRVTGECGTASPGAEAEQGCYTTQAVIYPGREMLMVVDDPANLSSPTAKRKDLFEKNGWQVETIAAAASATEYENKAENVQVVYIASSASESEVGTKLKGVPVGVVSGNPDVVDEMGLAERKTNRLGGKSVTITGTDIDEDHTITDSFTNDSIQFAPDNLLSSPTLHQYTIGNRTDVETLATDSDYPAMLAIDAGGQNYDDQFVLDGGEVKPTEDYATKITVLGVVLGDNHDATMEVRAGTEKWGPYVGLNDDKHPSHYVIEQTLPANEPLSIIGTGWIRGSGETMVEADSKESTKNVKTFRDGDPLQKIEPYPGEAAANSVIADYVDESTNTVDLQPNQAIYYFELTTTDMDKKTADFNDMIVLVTLAKDPSGLGDAAARRVFMPFNDQPDLTKDGEQLLLRSLDWARGRRDGDPFVRRGMQP